MQNTGDENPAREHTEGINCQCTSCQSKYGSLPLLVEGIERNEGQQQPSTSYELSSKDSRKLMKCVHCDKNFTHKGDLNKHLRTHTGEQPFSCTVCDKKFAHTSNLNRHMRLHSGDRPFRCITCSKSFNRKDKLDQHQRSCNKTS